MQLFSGKIDLFVKSLYTQLNKLKPSFIFPTMNFKR